MGLLHLILFLLFPSPPQHIHTGKFPPTTTTMVFLPFKLCLRLDFFFTSLFTDSLWTRPSRSSRAHAASATQRGKMPSPTCSPSAFICELHMWMLPIHLQRPKGLLFFHECSRPSVSEGFIAMKSTSFEEKARLCLGCWLS